jgi:hypothetical protein
MKDPRSMHGIDPEMARTQGTAPEMANREDTTDGETLEQAAAESQSKAESKNQPKSNASASEAGESRNYDSGIRRQAVDHESVLQGGGITRGTWEGVQKMGVSMHRSLDREIAL